VSVPVGASRIYFTPSSFSGLPNPFIGSAAVTADQQMACNVNTMRNDSGVGSTGTPARADANQGFDSNRIGTTLYVPQLDKNYSNPTWNSYLAVQNTESNPITVTVAYTDRFGTSYPSATENIQIPGQSNHVFYPSNNVNLPDNLITGAVINGTGKIAAVASFFNGATDYTTSQFNTYAPLPSGGNKLFVPRLLRNYHAFNSGISIQNVGAAPTSATITFSFGGSTYITSTGTINPGALWLKYLPTNVPELAPVDALPQPQRFGSAVIQAAPGGSIIANVNEDNRGNCNGVAGCTVDSPTQIGWSDTILAVPDGSQTTTVFIAEFMSHVGSPDYSGGFQITNTTGSAGTCNFTYSGASAANETGVTLPANGSISRFGPNVVNLPSGFDNSVIATCTQPVIGIYNFSARSSTYYGDTSASVNAVNQ
jgi:hypothetical protein